MRYSLFVVLSLAVLLSSCNKDGGSTKYLDIGTAPKAGVFSPVGTALAETLNKHKGDNKWKAQAKETKGSQENIRRLESGDLQLAISNASISYFAYRGTSGWNEKHDIRAVATIAPNMAMFLTTTSSGIKTMQDLKGKRVICGPDGAGFEMFVGPILEAHGLSFDDFDTKLNAVPGKAVEQLQDGKADAAFLGGAVPTGAVVRACQDMDIVFIPYDPKAVEQLIADYAFFDKGVIPASAYSDLEEDYDGLNVGSMHLITHADMDEETIYQVTKTIYENRKTIGHDAPKEYINETNAARDTGIPFHPGAIRFYKEAGAWPEEKK